MEAQMSSHNTMENERDSGSGESGPRSKRTDKKNTPAQSVSSLKDQKNGNRDKKKLTYSEESSEDDSDVSENFIPASKESKKQKRKRKDKGTSGMEDRISRIIEATIRQRLPSIEQSVRRSVEETYNKLLEEIEQKLNFLKDSTDRDKFVNKMKQDKLEQYTRKDNIRIIGVKEEDNEKEEDLLATLHTIAEAAGTKIEGPISAIHRVGRRGQRPRQVIVRFVVRRDKAKLMKQKKNLKNNTKIRDNTKLDEKVILVDDLTDGRMKLLKIVREHRDTEFAYTVEGTIICKTKKGQFHRIETADDLFNLGIDDVRYEDIYE